jgi:hypothetical protein
MATNGRGSSVLGYNVQVAVDSEHHLVVAHEFINVGNDRGQLARMSKQAEEVLVVDKLEAIADRRYFDGEEILACEEAGISVTLPKPMTSGRRRAGSANRTSPICLMRTPIAARPAGCCPIITPTSRKG